MKYYEKGVNLLYSDTMFQKYCKKFEQNKNYQLVQTDIIYMQNHSQIIEYLMSVWFIRSYSEMLTEFNDFIGCCDATEEVMVALASIGMLSSSQT